MESNLSPIILESVYLFEELVVILVLIDVTGQRVRYMVLKPRLVVDGKVVQS